MHALPEPLPLRLWNKVRVFYWLALVVVSILILFFPRTLGLPSQWRRCLVWVICIDLWLVVHGLVRAIVDNGECLTCMNKAWFGTIMYQVKSHTLKVLVLSAILYLPLWPIDKILDVMREHAEKKERIANFLVGEREMPDALKTVEEGRDTFVRCPWRFETKNIEVRDERDTIVVGNSRFVVALSNEGRSNRLYSLHPKASIAELSSFATYLYNDLISQRIRSISSVSREMTALVEFCYQVQVAYIESLSYLVCDAFFRGEKDKLRDQLWGEFPYTCQREFTWDETTKELMSLLSFRLQGREIGKTAIKYGGVFAKCNPKYIVARLKDIEQNTAIDIKNNSYKDSKFPLNECEEFAAAWRELHIVAYYEAAQQLMRMSKEISTALLRVRDTSGYDNLHRKVETWRPLATKALRHHCYLFCDLPLVAGTHVAFREVSSAEGFLKNDRIKASRSVFQLSRMLSDGKLTTNLQSNYAANQFVQFHGVLKRVMGKKAFESLMTSLKLPNPEALKIQEIK